MTFGEDKSICHDRNHNFKLKIKPQIYHKHFTRSVECFSAEFRKNVNFEQYIYFFTVVIYICPIVPAVWKIGPCMCVLVTA